MKKKQCTGCRKIKGLSRFVRSVRSKSGHLSRCLLCYRITQNAYREKNKERCNKLSNDRYYRNKEKRIASTMRWRNKNLDRVNEYRRSWSKGDGARKTKRTWNQANRHRCNAYTAKRRSSKLKATPKWLTKEQLNQMQRVYQKAIDLTQQTGIPHDVDHIVPLQGKGVRGLHVPWNLQILTASENRRKWNQVK